MAKAPTAAAALQHLTLLSGGEANAVVLAYRHAMEAEDLASATINRRLAALRSVTKLARTLGQITWAVEIDGLKNERRRDVRGPDTGERKRIFKAMKVGDTPLAIRDRAAVALLFGLGLRRSEVLGLDLADVDFRGRSVRVLRKGRREKVALSLPAEVARYLGEWALARGSEPGPLFTRTDRPGSLDRLSGEGLARAVARLGEAAKLDRRLTPHQFRHAAVTKIRSGGINDRDAIAFSGHATAKTLELYDDTAREAQGKVAGMVSKELG